MHMFPLCRPKQWITFLSAPAFPRQTVPDESSMEITRLFAVTWILSVCYAPDEYLLLGQKTEISRLVMDSDMSDDGDDRILPIQGLKSVKALAYDPGQQQIYWIEGRQKMIKRAPDHGSTVEVVVNGKTRPYDIAIDPFSKTLYWTCSKHNVINVTRLDMTPVGVVLQGPSNFKPRSLVLFPERGYMFYTNMIKSPRIESARMDGSEKTELFIKGLVHPVSLTIDKTERKLYWVDAGKNRIEMSDLTGRNHRVFVDGDLVAPWGLAVHGQFLYWLDRDQQLLERCQKKTGAKRLWVRGRMQELRDLIAVQHSLDVTSHPCAVGNGGCSHICMVDSDIKARCSCPYNLVLKKDGLTCADPPTCPPDHFTCKSGGITCIPLVWRCDNMSECEDSSDEQDCLICGPTQFHCQSGECVSKDNQCDGTANCKDGSDERGCCAGVPCASCESQGQGACAPGELQDCSEGEAKCVHQPTVDKVQDNATHYTICIVVGAIYLIVLIVVIFYCRRKTRHVPFTDDDIPPQSHTLSSRGVKTSASRGLSLSGTSLASGLPPFYDHSHVTGASSSSSTGTQYPQETLNPPPSPITERSVYTGGGHYCSSQSVGTVQSALRQHKPHRSHHYHHHHHSHIPPTTTPPCSTDVCDDSEPYPANLFLYYFNNSLVDVSYDCDPYPPSPTPHQYFSDDVSCPPSPSTERNYFNPYPPPPSPVGNSDCM